MNIYLPDGKSLELPEQATAADAARLIGPGLAKAAIGAIADGDLYDLMKPLPSGARLRILTEKDPEYAQLFRHTLAHVMAQAVRELYRERGFSPEAVKLAIGPVIENGFYYDIDAPEPLREEDLPLIEAKMHRIVGENLPLHRFVLSRREALERYQGIDPYKTELIENLPPGEEISFYQQGDDQNGFTDLCRGPHVPSTGRIPPYFKLTSIAGAYWRGDSSRPMLQRIYGIAFSSKAELDHYLWQQEEAKRRDHRKLGQELDLFTISEEVGKGLPLWLPKGAFVRRQLEQYMYDKEQTHGYHYVYTPHIGHAKLYYTSGHLPYYKDDMYAPIEIEGEEYYLKPMNCPHHHMIYKARPHSYRDLPLRLAEFGTVYRFELSGTLSGLTRGRGFTQNDAHIYCSKAQVKGEFIRVIQLFDEVYKDFGIQDYWFRLSLPDFENNPEKFGEPGPHWEEAIAAIRAALDETGAKYVEGIGEATFYGPKLDVQARTVLGKEESVATNQLDFISGQRFGLEFTNERGEKETPVIIHRAIMGSFDRFFAFYLEHTAGDFPLWLSPTQAVIVPISDRHLEYAEEVAAELRQHRLRVEVDDRPERMNAKIRDAELQKIPLVLVVGDKETQTHTVNLRERHVKDQRTLSRAELIGEMLQRVAERR
ncbi:threonine--tRNA ligase [Meiothermus granaticius]|uniref:Threonine--tRNA ligase n=1 Tax=Meiothermus granaticius NBRC 107808 TaxID=1227551 RepID=A0A399F655_9DEIN|nr:threonine--tRNA ligase [Meiothermus granaticius]MCL6525924.1 threonine--tRNA ligase [Thermaceae bacterium]RIH91573.1 Threonine--tRNA ligase [Meiothermus granaticius NBRC 107808]GEM85442.1 threonine--tRNA ligase [Meiothermus granaticius NBRC 107808]